MNRADAPHSRSRYWPGHVLLLLLPACFHTEYFQDDAGSGHDAAMADNGAAGPPLDAFDYASCPPAYNLTLPGQLPGKLTRYRLITMGALAWVQSDACDHDSGGGGLPGITRLAVVKTPAEVASIQMLVDQQPMGKIEGNAVLIGGVQLNNATTPGEFWLGFDDAPLIDNAWYMSNTPCSSNDDCEPNDFDHDESDHKEQFVSIIAGNDGLNDADGSERGPLKGALCECDGHSIAPKAAAAVNSYRMP